MRLGLCLSTFLLGAGLLAGLPSAARSLKDGPVEEAPKRKTKAEKYEYSAKRLTGEAERLEKRLGRIPEPQRGPARELLVAKRELARIKLEAVDELKKHLGTLPDEFKDRLKAAQKRHSAIQKEYYRIGRELRAAKKAESKENPPEPASEASQSQN